MPHPTRLFLAAMLAFGLCSVAAAAEYGAPMPEGDAMSVIELLPQAERHTGHAMKFSGRITQVCQAKGCWVMLDANGTGSETFTGDSNADAVADGLAWLIGATSPGQNALSLLPAAQMSSNNLVLNFKRLNASARGSALLKLEYSNLLTAGSWTSVSIPDEDGVVDGVQFSFTPDGEDHDQVQATVPSSKANGSGKLFVRLRGEAGTSP